MCEGTGPAHTAEYRLKIERAIVESGEAFKIGSETTVASQSQVTAAGPDQTSSSSSSSSSSLSNTEPTTPMVANDQIQPAIPEVLQPEVVSREASHVSLEMLT